MNLFLFVSLHSIPSLILVTLPLPPLKQREPRFEGVDMGKQEPKLIVDKLEKEAAKLERRFHDAEQRYRHTGQPCDEKIMNSHSRRKVLLHQKKDSLAQLKQTEKIKGYRI